MKKIILILALFSTTLLSQLTSVFNLQGVLRTPIGKAATDGRYSFLFKIYTQPEGGAALSWQETQSLEVKNGIYNALIGSVTPFSGLAFDRIYYIGISVAGGSEMVPRIQLTASPYALSLQGTNNKVPNSGAMQFDKDVWHKSSDSLERIRFNNRGKTNLKEGLTISGSTEITANAGTLSLYGTNHSYIQYFPDGLDQGRKGLLGFSDAATTNFEIRNEETNGNLLLMPSGFGKVGVGTPTPTAKLDVNGDIKANNIMTKVAEFSSSDFNNAGIAITGLNGNLHTKYKVFFDVAMEGGNDTWLYFYFNNDITAGTYIGESNVKFHGSGIDQASYNNAIIIGRNGWSQGGRVSGEITVYASSGKNRSVYGEFMFASATNPVRGYFSGVWKNTSANITAIGLQNSQNNKFRDGTITVYAIP